MPDSPHLIILLHGIGASGAQMMPLVTSWRSAMATARFVAPDAPFPHWRGHQWFAIDGNPLAPERVELARRAFDDLVKALVKRGGFDNSLDRVAFVGVSQGAIIALDAVASGRWKVGALVSYAGLLPPTLVAKVSSATPILLVHGQEDATIPAAASVVAAGELRKAGFAVDLEVLAGVGHTISSDGAEKGLNFLKRALRG